MKNKWSLYLLAALAGIWLLPACATFFQSDKQAVRVTSAPVSATVSVNGKRQGSAPTVVWLARTKRKQVIRLESPGYNTLEVRINRRPNALPYVLDAGLGFAVSTVYEEAAFLQNETRTSTKWISLTLCVGIPVLIDLASGKANTLSPRTLSVTLTKAEGPPRVETIFVEAEDLQEIERIRVNRD
jgi:hypothetical protein